jgi:peptidoglycan/LPS O-acetylase OafA/YrhL
VIGEFYSYERMFEFPLGFVAYLLWRRGIRMKPLYAAILVAVAYTWMAVVQWTGDAGPQLIYFGAPSFLIVASSLSLESAVGTNLVARVAILVGNASYATYLSHPYCVEAARKLLPRIIRGFDVTAPVGATLVIIGATAFGCLLYWFADRPLHKGARLLLQGKLVVAPRAWRLTRADREV